MNDRQRLHKIAEELNIPDGRWCIAGSGVMVLSGMERNMRDVDIYCATQTWFSLMKDRSEKLISSTNADNVDLYESSPLWSIFCTDPDDSKSRCDPPYLYRVMFGIEVNVFFSWRRRSIGDRDIAFLLHNACKIDGLPCIPLRELLYWKEEMGRSKDVEDIRQIKQHMGARGEQF